MRAIGLSTLRTSRDDRIRAFVSLAGMVHVAEFMQRMFGHLTPGQDVMLDKPHCPLTQHFLDDAAEIGDVLAAGASIRVPWLQVHGTEDEIVPLQDSLDARVEAEGRPDLVELPGCDHRYTGFEASMTAAVL